MEETRYIGTGNSYVQVNSAEILRLENTPITAEQIGLFLGWQQIPARVELSSRNTKQRWGTAIASEGRIILYRHSVWTFLHEIAHIIAGHKCGHSGDFPVALRGLYLAWKEIEG